MAQNKRERTQTTSARGFTKQQDKYLNEGLDKIFEDLRATNANPDLMMEALNYILKKSDHRRLAKYLEHEKFKQDQALIQHILALHILYYTPKKSELFKNLPGCDDLNEVSSKQIETFHLNLKDKIELENKALGKMSNIKLAPAQADYFRKIAIKPAANTIAEFNVNDLQSAIAIFELILNKNLKKQDFFNQLADLLGKAYGGDSADLLTLEVKKKCETFWRRGESDNPTETFTQKMHDLCNDVCSLAMLIRKPKNNLYVSKCPLINPDNSTLSKQQLADLTTLTRNELKFFIDALKNPKVMSNKKWQLHKEKFKELQRENELLKARGAAQPDNGENEKLQAEVARLHAELEKMKIEAKHPPTLIVVEESAEPQTKKQRMPEPEAEPEEQYDDEDSIPSAEEDSFVYSDSDDDEDEANTKKVKIVHQQGHLQLEHDLDESGSFAQECIAGLLFSI